MKLWIFMVMVLFSHCKKASYEATNNRSSEDEKRITNPTPVVNVGVEVVYQGRVIQETTVLTEVNVRPTQASVFDTSAPQCANKGFARIDYDFGDGTTQTVSRPTTCEEPSVRKAYQAPGSKTITMRMTAPDGTVFMATTILVVKAMPTPQPPIVNPEPSSPPIIDYWVPCDPCGNQIYYQVDPCDPCANSQRPGLIRRIFSRFQ